MERHYERELEELRSSLIDMGELVDRQASGMPSARSWPETLRALSA